MTMLRSVWVALLVVCMALVALAHADPREMESAEFKDEFGEEFEDRVVRVDELDERLEFALEHNIPSGSSAFSPRGSVELVFSSSSIKPKVTFLNLPVLSAEEIAHLEGMLQKNQHYTVRVRSNPANADSSYVVASVPMCLLAGTRMREDISFHISDSGKMVAMEYLTPYADDATCAEYRKRSLANVKLAAAGSVIQAQNGPSPPKQLGSRSKKAPKLVKNPVKDEEGGEAPAEENQSFLRRYWYIILPLVIMSFFGGDAAPEGGAAGGAPAAGGATGPRRR